MAKTSRSHTPTLAERVFRDLAHTLEFDQFFQKAAAGAAAAAGAELAGLALRNGDTLSYRYFFGLTPTQSAALDQCSLPWGAGVVGQSLESGATVYIPSYPESPQAIREFVDLGVQSTLVAPITVAGRMPGALAIAWRTRPKRPPSPRVQLFVETLAAFIGSAYHRSTLEAALSRDAHHDLLTGLPNRAMLEYRLTEAQKSALRRDRLLAVTLLDIDGFKGINDHMGHQTGDYILTQTAKRLATAVRATDMVSRYGGDEFVILFEDIAHLEQLEAILDRMLASIRQPVSFKGQHVAFTISAGLTIYPFDDHSPELLLQHADQAMYEAKRAGGNQYQYFDRAHTVRVAARSRLRREIEKAIQDDLWMMTYQPIVDWEGQTVALEGRMRWERSPGLMIREEDVSDLLDKDLRAHFFERLLAITERDVQAQNWPPLSLHLNLHRADLDNDRFLTLLNTWCEDSGISPARLILELPETAVTEQPTASRALAYELQERGIGLLIDDSHSNQQTCVRPLADLPILGVKYSIPVEYRRARLIHALTAAARALGLLLYGQSINDPAQGQLAKNIGCVYGQGTLFGPELLPKAAQHWLKTATYPPKHSS